tara:strand:+ start:18247 stop:19596 length:1350 start_codon:yes stop_codon:yes gene_type:complete
MAIEFLLERFKENENQPAVIWQDRIITYSTLLERYHSAQNYMADCDIKPGETVTLIGDYTPNTIAILLALIENKNIIAPFNYPIKENERVKFDIAEIQKEITVNIEDDTYDFKDHGRSVNHDFYKSLREEKKPGLVMFSSGTSGAPKGAVHDFTKILERFKPEKKTLRTINFLLFDHLGGFYTLFYTLSNCGVVLALRDRRPETVCNVIEKYDIELLPVTPSFLNLLLLSESYNSHDLSSLKLITYGTEPMPLHTLHKAKKVLPEIRFKQTYGLIELGVVQSKSKSDDSLWMKLGGDGFKLRVVDNLLQIKADTAMMGYLNAPSPFTEDGYLKTGDEVEVDGDYFKILGRKSELINVGGDKVYPQEVENVIMDMDNVREVIVYGEKHIILGNIVCAKVSLNQEEEKKEFIKKLKSYCKERLQPFKVPVKIFIEEGPFHSDRFKKVRTNG